jgi:protein-L-isoaspartate(D-aspartate) O-methyltransferase
MDRRASGNERSAALDLHQALVARLKSQGHLRTPAVEAAFRAVPRHLFVPGVPLEEAYSDRAISIYGSEGGHVLSASSQPFIMATMLEQLDLKPGKKVLEIGAGSGYNAALMSHIVAQGGKVVTVDIDPDIVTAARAHLAAAGFGRVEVVCADGGYGYADAAPYDRIILTVGAWDIAPAWWDQLKPEGRLVMPLELAEQRSVAFEQEGDHLSSRSAKVCGFMRLRGAFADPQPARVVPLGADPGLEMWVRAPHAGDATKVYQWLLGPGIDWETKVRITVQEIDDGLSMWLALHEPDLGRLVAWDDEAERQAVPPLIGLGDTRKHLFTPTLFGDRGMAALMRPPGQPAPLGQYAELFAPGPSFPLFVRQFGTGDSLAQRLVARVQAWDAAGCPASAGLRVRAYRRDSDEVPPVREGEVVVEKRWTRLILDWPAHA